MDNASEEYRVKAAEWVDLDAAARMLEEGKTTYLAQRMTAFADMAVSKAEREVKSSQDWADYIKKMVHARTAANRAKFELKYIEMKYWENSSAQATKRSEMRM